MVCSHTLEDVRDPLRVCSEMIRVGKAGYIEVPSRLEEQSWGVVGEFVGWGHHRWLIDVEPGSIAFTQKLHSLHAEPDHYLPAGFAAALPDAARVQSLWWEGDFSYGEFILHDDEENRAYLRPLVERGLRRASAARDAPASAQPPATAGRIVTSSPSSTDVSRPSRNLMSSPPT